MRRTVRRIATEIAVMLESVAGSSDPATSEQERSVAASYAKVYMGDWARDDRANARLTKLSLIRHIMVGFNYFNPTLEEFSERRRHEGKSFVEKTMAELDIAERLRDKALEILNRDA